MAWPVETDLEDYLHREFTDDEDSMASIAIAGAKAVVRAWTHQYLEATTSDVIEVDGLGSDVLLLPEFPVTAVSSVTISSETDFDDTNTEFKESGLLYRTDLGVWPPGINNITVTYDHGYDDTDEMWDAVKLVVLGVAGRLFEQGGAASESTGGFSANYAFSGPGLSPSEIAALAPWRSKI